jgi:hypothetical protein
MTAPTPLQLLQAATDTQARKLLNAFTDLSPRSLTNAVNPNGSSGTVAFQGDWSPDSTNHYTVTVNVSLTPVP